MIVSASLNEGRQRNVNNRQRPTRFRQTSEDGKEHAPPYRFERRSSAHAVPCPRARGLLRGGCAAFAVCLRVIQSVTRDDFLHLGRGERFPSSVARTTVAVASEGQMQGQGRPSPVSPAELQVRGGVPESRGALCHNTARCIAGGSASSFAGTNPVDLGLTPVSR